MSSLLLLVASLPTLAAVVYLLVHLVRRCMTHRVNCWFCNADQRVVYAQRNAFICSVCEQYNGFTPDGDYNRVMHEQHTIKHTGGDRTKKQRGEARGNGLCNACNRKQALYIRQLREFEPINEKTYADELQQLKEQLNSAYPLCAKCDQVYKEKVQRDTSDFNLHAIRSRTRSIAATSVSGRTWRSRKTTSGERASITANGKRAFIARVQAIIVAAGVALAAFDHLQIHSEYTMVSLDGLPSTIRALLPRLHRHALWACVFAICLQAFAIRTCATRLTLADVVAIPAWLLLAVLHSPMMAMSEDLCLAQTAIAYFLFVLSIALIFLPRKAPSRRRRNRLQGAFSIVSTPSSQSSSSTRSSPCTTRDHIERSPTMQMRVTGARESSRDREFTPSRQLGAALSTLSLGECDRPVRRGGPFPSMTFSASTYKHRQSSAFFTQSKFTDVSSQLSRFTASSVQSQLFANTQRNGVHSSTTASVLTSASQLDVQQQPSLLVKLALIVGIVSVLLNCLTLYFIRRG